MTESSLPSPGRAPSAAGIKSPDPWPARVRRKLAVGRDLLRIHGPARFFGRIVPWTYSRRYFLFEGLSAGPTLDPGAAVTVRCSLARPGDLPLLLSARPGFYSLDRLEERLAAGHACFIAWLDGRPAGIRWAFTGSVYLPYLSRTLVLARDEAYSDELYVVPRFRGRGVDEGNFSFMRSWFSDRGYRKHYCLLTPWDDRLRRRYERRGMAKAGEVVRLGGPLGRKYRWHGLFYDLGQGRVALARDGSP
jgi:GNAT superfamily N-acetyltransferase